jgi:hypothetical protein
MGRVFVVPDDLEPHDRAELNDLAGEIRDFILANEDAELAVLPEELRP